MATVVQAGIIGPSLQDKMIAIARPTSGFDYMRLSLSIIILIWHSLLVTHGLHWAENVMFSPIGVVVRFALPMFFALSGFLVAGSLERNPSIPVFVTFRALRILPALAVEITLSALVIGAATTTLTLSAYYSDPQFRSYFLNIAGWIHYTLPEVFQSNPDNTVNRSLWTIPSELECYLFLITAAAVGLFVNRKQLFIATTAIFLGYVSFRLFRDGATPGFQPHGGTVLSRLLIFYFMAGVLTFKFRDRIAFSLPLFAICFAISVVTLSFQSLVWLSLPTTVYITVYLGLLNPRRIRVFLRGDYSYGIYLYAYPIQQTYVWLFPHAPSFQNVALALPTTAAFAVASWHFVERPALKLKTLAPKRAIREVVAV